MDYNVSLYLDKRSVNKDGLYSLKLRIYDRIRKKAKLFSLNKYYSTEEFKNINGKKVQKKYQEERLFFDTIKLKADSICRKIVPFNINEFEKHFFNTRIDGNNIVDLILEKIKEYYQKDQIKTAKGYESSLKSFQKFTNPNNPEKVVNIHILDITPKWLNKYEKYMLNANYSITTIGVYLRNLRAIYNDFIAKNPSLKNSYPFSKKGYTIPATKGTKRALRKEDLLKLFEVTPTSSHQQKAKDFWFLSFFCGGININDIARLRFKNISFTNNSISFFRGKTFNTQKANLKEIVIPINDYAMEIIKKYKNKNENEENYIFDIISKKDTSSEEVRKIDNFNRYVNQHIKKLAKDNGIDENISVYWARHSFSNSIINNGGSIEMLSQLLGHSDIKTTKAYIGSIDIERKKEVMSRATNFLMINEKKEI